MSKKPTANSFSKRVVSTTPKLCSRTIFLVSLFVSLLFISSIFLFQNRLYYVSDAHHLVADSALDRFKRMNQSKYHRSKLNNSTSDAFIHAWVVKDKNGLAFSTGINQTVHLSDSSILIGGFNKSSLSLEIEYPFVGSRLFISEEQIDNSILAVLISYEVYIDILSKDASISTVSESFCDEASILKDTDLKGNDLTNTEDVDMRTCCVSCAANPSCTHWTYVQVSNSCWMKGGIQNPMPITMSKGSGLSSGIITSRQNQVNMQKDIHKEKISSDKSFSSQLPPCSGKISSKKETWRNNIPISSTTLRRNVTNGDWLEQFPLGNGRFGALVGGNIKNEFIPLSMANWFTFKPADKSKSNERKKTMGAHYAAGREKLKEGLISEAISELSKVQMGSLGMFQYLADIMLTFSTLPFVNLPPTLHNRIISSNRASLNEWAHSMLGENVESKNLHSITIISENSLDMVSGISFETHVELHMQRQNISSATSIHWVSAMYREWFISAVDNVLIGKIHCKVLNNPDSKLHCVNLALGIIRQFTSEESNPTTIYEISQSNSKGIDIFDLNLEIGSSNHIFVPTSHVALRVLCHQGNPQIMGAKGKSDVGYTDSPMAICNDAAHVDIIAAVEAIDTLGDNNPAAFDRSKSTKDKLKRVCWERINLAMKKGILKVRSDHVNHMKSVMNSVRFSLQSSSEVHVSPPLGEITSEYLSQFGQGCFDEDTSNIKEDVFDRTLISHLYTFGRYLQLSSSQYHIPNLQGLWGDGNKAEWNGDYHLNINFQMMYWSAASAFPISPNHAVNILNPLVTFFKRLSSQGKEIAQIMYKEVTETTKHSSLLSEYSWVAHGFTDSTLRGDVMADLQWSLCVTCGAWAANHLFDIILYSNIELIDNETLLDILHIFRGIVDFFNSHLFSLSESEQTVLHTGPTTSPENSYTLKGNKGPSDVTAYLTFTPAIDISILREVSNSYYLSAKWISSLPKFRSSFDYLKQAEEFQKLVASMPNQGVPLTYEATVPLSLSLPANVHKPGINNHPIPETAKKYSRIREYVTVPKADSGQELEIIENTDLGHRHFSLLHWLYPAQFLPFTSVATENNDSRQKSLFEAAKGSLRLKRDHFGGHTSWSAVWEASLWARLGEGEESFLSLKHMISRYLTPNLLSLHPPLDIVGPRDCHTCFSDTFHKQLEQKKSLDINAVHRRLGTIPYTNENMENNFEPPPMAEVPVNYHREEDKVSADFDASTPLAVSANKISPNLRRESSPKRKMTSHHLGLANAHKNSYLVTRQRGLVTDRGDKFQLDGNLGYIAAIHEMLVQSYLPRRLILLPAVPFSWLGGGEILGLGIRGNAQLSMVWKEGKVQFVSVVFHSFRHPWWSHRIDERKGQPGFYEDHDEQLRPANELSIAGPNPLYFLPRAVAAGSPLSLPPLCDIQVSKGTWCNNCTPLPHQKELHVETIVVKNPPSETSSGTHINACTLLACDQDISYDKCWEMFLVSQSNIVDQIII